MPVIEPVVTEEKLRGLLDEQHESQGLDYKRTCDLNQTRDLVEVAKDVGAMQIDGGFIVLGADDRGAPTGELGEGELRLLDEAILRKKLARYIPEPFDIRCAMHEVEGKSIGLLYVGPSSKGFCIFKADGNYLGGSAFRAGEVFARHGSSSEPWNQGDIDRILGRLVGAEKEAWREEYRNELLRVTAGSAAQDLARAPAEAFTWRVDEQTFLRTTIEQLRMGDDAPLRLFLARVPAEASELLRQESTEEDTGTLIDRLVCLAATFLVLERHEFFKAVVGSLVSTYDLGFDQYGNHRRDSTLSAPGLWLAIVERIMALGGLAVRKEAWPQVRSIVLKRGHGNDFLDDQFGYNTWVRHAVTMAARSNLFKQPEGGRIVEMSLISLALQHSRSQECLRPGLDPEDERILNSVCQFDALACLVAIGEAKSVDGTYFYPNFARFYNHRSQPAIVRVITDESARQDLFPLDDQALATALRAIDERAKQIGWQYSGWDGFTHPRILELLKANPPIQEG